MAAAGMDRLHVMDRGRCQRRRIVRAAARGAEGGDRSVPQPSASGPLPVQDILAKSNPGVAGQKFTVGNVAKFIAAGSDIVFEIHYTTTGKPETDRSMVGIVAETARRRFGISP